MSEASDKITQFENDVDLANQIVNGDETTDVAVESGSCPTFRKTMAEMTSAGTGVVDQAQSSATAAAASEAKAEQWATSDVEVEGGLFSAKYYAEAASTVTGIVPATETAAGIIEIADESETVAGIVGNKAVSPKNLKAWEDGKSTPSPSSLSMDATVAEGVTVNGTYSIESGSSAIWSIPAEITTFVDNADGTFSFTAPNVDVDTNYTIGLASKNPDDKFQSDQVTSTIAVTDVVVQEATIVIADADGWDVAPVDGSIPAPATSVGVNNTSQIVSGQMEIVQTSNELTVESGTTATSLVTTEEVSEGADLVTNQGEVVAGSVTGVGPYTTDISSGGFSAAPTVAFNKHSDLSMKLGEGISDENLGPEIDLPWGSGSTASDLVFESSESIKDDIFIAGGNHNNVTIDGTPHIVSGVSETNSTSTVTEGLTGASNAGRQVGSVGGGNMYCPANMFVANATQLDSVTYTNLQAGDITHEAVIYKVVDGEASEPALGVSTQINMNSTGDKVFAFATPVDLEIGETYWVVLEHVSGTDDWVCDNTAYDFSGEFGSDLYVSNSQTLADLTKNGGQGVFGDESWRFELSYTATTYETTATMQTPLGAPPAGTEVVKIPNRCSLTPASYTYLLDGTELKIKSSIIQLTESASIKRVAMNITGSGLTIKSGRIYITELAT